MKQQFIFTNLIEQLITWVETFVDSGTSEINIKKVQPHMSKSPHTHIVHVESINTTQPATILFKRKTTTMKCCHQFLKLTFLPNHILTYSNPKT